ncbi:hypothetical protein PCE1_001952 [Barthelona sp. PCE]
MSLQFSARKKARFGKKNVTLRLSLLSFIELVGNNEEKNINMDAINSVSVVPDDKSVCVLNVAPNDTDLVYYFSDARDCHHFITCLNGFRNGKTSKEEIEEDVAPEPLKLYIGSWNVGNETPCPRLEAWIPKKGNHMYVFGVQEATYSPRDGYSNSREDIRGALKMFLGESYEEIAFVDMMEIRLVIFIHSTYVDRISDVQTHTEATGIAHVVGNKGAVGCSMKYNGTKLCFINSHLAAHQEKISARNDNFKEVVTNLKLGDPSIDILNQFDYLFWFGDLNYRINLPRPEVIRLVEEQNISFLLDHDQLLDQREDLAAFVGFNEAEVTFPPTYRYIKGTSDYDPKKGRIPSWCDRILWKSAPNKRLLCTHYNHANSVNSSDHKPVYATFALPTFRPLGCLSDPMDCHIRISDLKGKNFPIMDLNGEADPYVIFKGECLDQPVRTSTIKNTRNPEWDDNDVPALHPYITGSKSLSQHFITACIYDYDALSPDDLIGYCMIPLTFATGLCLPQPFECTVLQEGLPAGTLTGNLQIEYTMKQEE